jgi:hypothetical protein
MKIYDNYHNKNSNATTKKTKANMETKKKDPCWLYGKITRG